MGVPSKAAKRQLWKAGYPLYLILGGWYFLWACPPIGKLMEVSEATQNKDAAAIPNAGI